MAHLAPRDRRETVELMEWTATTVRQETMVLMVRTVSQDQEDQRAIGAWMAMTVSTVGGASPSVFLNRTGMIMDCVVEIFV